MKYFGILTLCILMSVAFLSSHAQSDEFEFVGLNDSYLLGEEFSIVFQKSTRQPCPSYDLSLMKEGIPESEIHYRTMPLCAISGLVEPYLFSGTFEKPEFFDSVGTYLIKITLDNETINKKIQIIHSEFSDIPPPLKQFKLGISIDEIQCKENLVLLQKYDDSPACVTPKSAQILYERGWTPTLKILVNRGAPSVYLGTTDIPSASNQFALNFYSHVSEDKKRNIFFSPTSIFTAFAITYEGAKDNTAFEMQHVFGFDPDKSKRTVQFADMQEQLNKKQQNNTISLANALWINEGFDVLPEYIDTAKTHYKSDIESINFSDKNSIDTINEWINEKTKGKIKKIFEDLDPSTKLAITNAIYFKGIWEEPFDQEKTIIGDFHVTSDNVVQVPMMESKTIFPNVAINDLVKIVELPYEGEKFSMLILLPRDEGMSSLEDSLSVDNLNTWKKELHAIKTKVYMPKFKLETEYDLKQILQDMGIHDAFGNADFTGISNSGLYIEKAAHKAFVEVNEEGTEAAAATGIAMLQSGPFEFVIDRPFVFIIQDNETGSILFMGKVVDPT